MIPALHWMYHSSIVLYFALPFIALGALGVGRKGSFYRPVAIALLLAFLITFLVTTRENGPDVRPPETAGPKA